MRNQIYQIVIGGLCLSSIFSSCEKEKNSIPTCEIIKPIDNDTIQIGDIVAIQAEANDEDGNISEVRFYIDNTGISSSTIYPYKYDWDTKSETLGKHKIKIEAKDDKGAQATAEKSIFIMGLPTNANAGSDQIFTDGKTTSVILAANKPLPNQGNGKWSIISGEGGKFENDTVANTTFTGLKCISYTLKWTISTAFNSTSDYVTISFLHTPTTANAGVDQNITDNKIIAVLAANKPVLGFGTGKWTITSGIGGSFEDESNPTTNFTGKSCATYVLKWTISTECASSADEVKVVFNNIPTKANAGADQIINDSKTQTLLNANLPVQGYGSGKWSVLSGTGGSFSDITNAKTTFSGIGCSSYSLRWTISTECSSTYDDVIVEFKNIPTTANAGIDQRYSDGRTSAILGANSPNVGYGSGYWTIISGSGGSFADATKPNTTFTGLLWKEYILRWTISTNCATSFDDVKISFTNKVIDIEGNKYNTVIIGSQIWMAENLKTTHYADGTQVIHANYDSSPGYYWYNNDISYKSNLGALYTYVGATKDDNSGNNVQGVCPDGWHLPNKAEWETLINYLGASTAGTQMLGASSSSGFNGLLGGYFYSYNSTFSFLNARGFWWTSTDDGSDFYKKANSYYLMDNSTRVTLYSTGFIWDGFSVRCVKD